MAIESIHTAKLSNEEWLEIRTRGLGGSDIGSMLGFNPFKSSYQLWLEKTGQIEPEDISDKVVIQIGNELEDLVARMFTQETGLRVQKDNHTHFHKDYPFLLANIDRKIIGQKALLECKTTGAHNRKQWIDDEVPASYLLQVQHYLNVLEYDKAYIAVIIGNNEFVWKEIERDQELIDIYTEKAKEFWEVNVQKNQPPEIDGSNSTRDSINQLYADEYDKEVPMNKLMINTVKELTELNQQIKQLQEAKSEKENQLKEFAGTNNASVLTSEIYQATWKQQSRTSLDTKRLRKEKPELFDEYSKTSSYKVLRVKENLNGDK